MRACDLFLGDRSLRWFIRPFCGRLTRTHVPGHRSTQSYSCISLLCVLTCVRDKLGTSGQKERIGCNRPREFSLASSRSIYHRVRRRRWRKRECGMMGDEVNRMACWIFVWSLVCEMFLSCGTEWYVERIVRTHPEPTVVARQVRAYEPATGLLRACSEPATSLLRACYEPATSLLRDLRRHRHRRCRCRRPRPRPRRYCGWST